LLKIVKIPLEMAPCQLQVRAASACGRPHKMCYKSLFKCAFVHHINKPKFVTGLSLRRDSEESTSRHYCWGNLPPTYHR